MNGKGAVAAGHPLTAEAACTVLREGGNAFDAALANVRKQGLTLDDVEREQFQIPEIADDIAGLFDEIQKGRGFVLIRGFPLDCGKDCR